MDKQLLNLVCDVTAVDDVMTMLQGYWQKEKHLGHGPI